MKKEIELKYLLNSKIDFDLFFEFLEPYACGKTKFYRQENFYFDTPALNLRRNKISLRLRKQNDDFLLSGKTSLNKKASKNNLSVRVEYEGHIDGGVAELMLQNLVSPIDVFSFLKAKTPEDVTSKKTLLRLMEKVSKTGLQMIGSFVNERTTMPLDVFDQRIYFEFDHSRYPQSVETYEVELEFPSEKLAVTMRPFIDTLFHRAGIKTKSSSSKSSRLYKILFKT